MSPCGLKLRQKCIPWPGRRDRPEARDACPRSSTGKHSLGRQRTSSCGERSCGTLCAIPGIQEDMPDIQEEQEEEDRFRGPRYGTIELRYLLYCSDVRRTLLWRRS